MIRIDYIQEFVKLADYLSFSRASEDLYITQPSLSRHISLLESELGVKLVERNTRNVRLTQAGAALYNDFNTLLEDYRTIKERARILSSGYRGHLTISTPAYWLAEYVEPAVLMFSQNYPGIKVELDICDPLMSVDRVRSGKSDLAIGFEAKNAKADIVGKKIFEERLCVVMDAGHPCAKKESVSLRDFQNDKFIIIDTDETNSNLVDDMQRLLTTHGIDPANFIFSTGIGTLGLSLRQTGAVCVLLGSLGTMGRDYLASVPLSDENAIRSLYLFRKKNAPGENALAFYDMAPFIRI